MEDFKKTLADESNEFLHWLKFISLSEIFEIIFILAIAYGVNFLLKRGITAIIHKKVQQIGTPPTNFVFLKNAVSFIVYTVAFFGILKVFGIDNVSTKLLGAAGILTAAIAFGSQNAIANLMSGLMLLMFKPIRVGDYINIDTEQLNDDQEGTVEAITMRETIIRDLHNRRIIIPNSIIAQAAIINSTIEDRKVCKMIEVGIGYSSDLKKAIEVFREVVEAHPLCIDNRTPTEKKNGTPKVIVRVVSLGSSSIVLRAYAWAPGNAKAFIITCDVFEQVKLAFDQQGIEIPYNYMNVVMQNPTPPQKPIV